MIHTDWLGYYWNKIDDPWDDPMHRLHLFVASSGVFCFEYSYMSRDNHGYGDAFEEGIVRSVVGSELVIEVTYRYGNSWDDYFKEHHLKQSTMSEKGIIKIKSIDEGNKPILSYKVKDMPFKCTDSVADSSFFARERTDAHAPKQTILAEYSQDLSNENIANDSLYSLPMKALLEERKSFYEEFFLKALHSDLTNISSTYDIRSITKDTKHQNTFIVKAAELIHFKAKYRLEPGGHPLINAANWAIAHTENLDVRKRLQEYIARYEMESRINSTDGYETDFVVEHTLIILTETNIFQIIQDSYTDANPQDNPNRPDVIEWQDGMFARKKPDYAGYPDYYAYHTSIEELGKNLLNDYSK